MDINKSSKKTILALAMSAGLLLGVSKTNQPAKAATVDRPKTYTVKKGDCFWSIAKKYKMSVRHLCAINGKHQDSMIYPKDKLKLKGKEKPVVEHTSAVQAQNTEVVAVAEVQQAPQAPVAEQNTSYVPSGSGESSAKAWIAQRESGGSYNAQNGRYIGKFQLDSAYLNGDYSPANQERVADKYVADRYGSWSAAQAFWQANGWY